eukprot:TRINITY_DN13395_c0_g2_i4.p1 TRINITY_DN13395_c0_g2~~TRINITY_DN13395_c0_g2_i4.p1  ORF type:complete len:220 (-),score=48.89 TRINITY_DN13395_c0_g2_i4:96-755(-)
MVHYTKLEYWEDRYKKEPDPFDWYQRYQGIKDCLVQYIKPSDRILNIGCGNSRLTEEMYKDGFCNSVNVDLCETVIKQMQERCREDCPEAKFIVMDIMKMDFESKSFDVVLDKATLDSFMCGETATTSIEAALNEVHRVLTDTGTFICISYGLPQDREGFFKGGGWSWKIFWEKVPKPSISPAIGGLKDGLQDQKSFHYVYVLKKQPGVEQVKGEQSAA